jgi:dTDP-glucose 4,6-dehydratase
MDLGWLPQETFETGIVKTIDWYLSNQDWLNRVTSGAYQDYYATQYKL